MKTKSLRIIEGLVSVMSSDAETSWSQWMDFERKNVEDIPELSGVYMMHAAMKILYIGSGENLRQKLLESLSEPCISKAKRFRYMATQLPDEVKEQLLNEYLRKHGKLPECIEK